MAAAGTVVYEMSLVTDSLEDAVPGARHHYRGGPPMNAQIPAELLKLRTTRTTWGVLTAAVAVAGLLGVASVSTGGDLVDVVGVSSLPAFVMLIWASSPWPASTSTAPSPAPSSPRPAGAGFWSPSCRRRERSGPSLPLALMGAATVAALPVIWIDGATIDLGRAPGPRGGRRQPARRHAVRRAGRQPRRHRPQPTGRRRRSPSDGRSSARGSSRSSSVPTRSAGCPASPPRPSASHGSDGLPLWAAAALVRRLRGRGRADRQPAHAHPGHQLTAA